MRPRISTEGYEYWNLVIRVFEFVECPRVGDKKQDAECTKMLRMLIQSFTSGGLADRGELMVVVLGAGGCIACECGGRICRLHSVNNEHRGLIRAGQKEMEG